MKTTSHKLNLPTIIKLIYPANLTQLLCRQKLAFLHDQVKHGVSDGVFAFAFPAKSIGVSNKVPAVDMLYMGRYPR